MGIQLLATYYGTYISDLSLDTSSKFTIFAISPNILCRKFPSSLWSGTMFGTCKKLRICHVKFVCVWRCRQGGRVCTSACVRACMHVGGRGREREIKTLSPKKFFVLSAMASINFSSRNWGVSFNLFASPSFMTLKEREQDYWFTFMKSCEIHITWKKEIGSFHR